jgi:N utilization substance protein A
MTDDLLDFKVIKRPLLLKLGRGGVRTLADLADLAADEMIEIIGAEEMKESVAGRIIMKARDIVYGIKESEEEAVTE